MILLIDNYDSFTYNLVDLLGKSEPAIEVWRNDRFELAAVRELQPQGIVISPGPGTPDDAGISCEVIRRFHTSIPILGVCLGHQCIATVFGGKVVKAPLPVHGKLSIIEHDQAAVFSGLPTPLNVVRYHSLIIERESLPSCFDVTAETADNIIMGIVHRHSPLTGVQFHPEAILSEQGEQLLNNWLLLCLEWEERMSK